MPRYVVLHHTGHGLPHYDLMLAMDEDSPLLTWRLPAWPPATDDAFEPLPAHRRAYLTYEGPVSNNRGEVRRIAEGVFEIGEDGPAHLQIRIGDPPIRLTLPRPL